MKEQKRIRIWMRLACAVLVLDGMVCFLELAVQSGSKCLLFGIFSGIFGLFCLRKVYCIGAEEWKMQRQEEERHLTQIRRECESRIEEARQKASRRQKIFEVVWRTVCVCRWPLFRGMWSC